MRLPNRERLEEVLVAIETVLADMNRIAVREARCRVRGSARL